MGPFNDPMDQVTTKEQVKKHEQSTSEGFRKRNDFIGQPLSDL